MYRERDRKTDRQTGIVLIKKLGNIQVLKSQQPHSENFPGRNIWTDTHIRQRHILLLAGTLTPAHGIWWTRLDHRESGRFLFSGLGGSKSFSKSPLLLAFPQSWKGCWEKRDGVGKEWIHFFTREMEPWVHQDLWSCEKEASGDAAKPPAKEKQSQELVHCLV